MKHNKLHTALLNNFHDSHICVAQSNRIFKPVNVAFAGLKIA